MIPTKRTKIVATIGPSSQDEKMLEKVLRAGVDIVRLNFSHGDQAEQAMKYHRVRALEKKLGKHIGIIGDIQGPKIRVGKMPEGGIQLKEGQTVTVNCKATEYANDEIPLPSMLVADGTKVGSIIFLDDGTLSLKITKKMGTRFEAKVEKGGTLFSKKGVNVPFLTTGSPLSGPKDKSDITFAVDLGVDFIAISFLKDAKDIKNVRKFMGKKQVPIIAKVERPEALDNIEEIAEEADAVMVARGDLGIETPLYELPIKQKEIIDVVRKHRKPVIVATQMLDSMMRNPIPTRAEVSDVANAVFDGADAVMLSGESAQGKYPLEAVTMMRQVLESTERDQDYVVQEKNHDHSLKTSIAAATTNIAAELKAKAILSGAVSGESARILASFRPATPIVAMANNERTAQRLALSWGVTPVVIKLNKVSHPQDLVKPCIDILKKGKFLKKGDKVVCRYSEKLGDADSASAITVDIIS